MLTATSHKQLSELARRARNPHHITVNAGTLPRLDALTQSLTQIVRTVQQEVLKPMQDNNVSKMLQLNRPWNS